MKNEATDLDVERRLDIVWNVDAQECQGCGAAFPQGVASDPDWFIDSEGHRDADGEAYEVAIIRCPKCWQGRVTALRRVKRTVFQCRCERCGHEWETLKLPRTCAHCKQTGWQVPKGELPLGRPPKEKK